MTQLTPAPPFHSMQQPASPQSPARFSKLAIWGFVLTFFVPIVGAIISHIALSTIRTEGLRGRGLALAGVWCGWVFSVIYVLCLPLLPWLGWMLLLLMFGAPTEEYLDPISFYIMLFGNGE